MYLCGVHARRDSVALTLITHRAAGRGDSAAKLALNARFCPESLPEEQASIPYTRCEACNGERVRLERGV